MTCDVCGRPVDPDTAHWTHWPECLPDGDCDCTCYRPVHPECCPNCQEHYT